jgi:DMATS type aromatic prenyltransferase
MATFVRAADRFLEKLCEGMHLQDSCEEFRRVQRLLLEEWGLQEIPEVPSYRSSIGDDHSPFEYSIAVGAQRTELRLLVEVQGSVPNAVSNQEAALNLNRRLAQTFNANFERFERIEPLFLPQTPDPPFSLWHAACLGREGQHDFKVYLNPQVRGADQANALVGEALVRLGMSGAARVVASITSHAKLTSSPNYFSLDLSASPSARVKIYFQHPRANAQQVDEIFRLSPNHRSGDVVEFCRTLVGGDGPFDRKPVTSCFSFVEGRDEPTAATFHMPIAHYVPNDSVTVDRVTRYLAAQGIDPSVYVAAVHAFAMRPLDDGAGIQSYASFRREKSGIRLTAYLSPELYREPDCSSELRLKAPSIRPSKMPGQGSQHQRASRT